MTKLPTVDIKGQEYVLVKDRILEFNKRFPNGSITTELLSDVANQSITFKATVRTGEGGANEGTFTGHAQERIGDGFINKTSALENAETSAVGRALAMLGIGVIDSVASVDEIVKANNNSKDQDLNRPTLEQKQEIGRLAKELAISYSPDNNELAEYCTDLMGIPQPNNREQAEILITALRSDLERQEELNRIGE